MVVRGRLLQQAVERHGYTVLAIEESSSRAEALDRYVLYGEGDPVAVIRDLGYWMYHNREFLERPKSRISSFDEGSLSQLLGGSSEPSSAAAGRWFGRTVTCA